MVTYVVVTVFFAVITSAQGVANDTVCVPGFPGYFVSGTHEAIFHGCFHNGGETNTLPKNSLVNLRASINWYLWLDTGYAKDIIEDCGKRAIELGVLFFGVEFYGECYFGDNPKLSGDKVTVLDGCDNLCSKYGVGGASSMAVYEVKTSVPQCPPTKVGYYIDDAHWAWNYGCYAQDSDNFVFPQDSFVSRRAQIDWGQMGRDGHAGDMVKKCGLVALEKGALFFGIEFYGNCFYGNTTDMGNGQLPCNPQKCFFDLGIKGSLQLYEVKKV